MHFKTYINNRGRIFIAITSKNRYFVRTIAVLETSVRGAADSDTLHPHRDFPLWDPYKNTDFCLCVITKSVPYKE